MAGTPLELITIRPIQGMSGTPPNPACMNWVEVTEAAGGSFGSSSVQTAQFARGAGNAGLEAATAGTGLEALIDGQDSNMAYRALKSAPAIVKNNVQTC